MVGLSSGINSQVLVLNNAWLAIRITEAKRAFSLLIRDAAEVIRVDDGSYAAHDFQSWAELTGMPWDPGTQESSGDDRFDAGSYEWVRTVRMQIAVPKVIRLCRYDRLPRQEVKLNRKNIFARDSHRCQYCALRYPVSQLSLDHVVPRSQGGVSSWENLVCCCVRCNTRKGGRTPSQAQMRLVGRPRKPRRHPMINLRMHNDRYSSWRAFLS